MSESSLAYAARLGWPANAVTFWDHDGSCDPQRDYLVVSRPDDAEVRPAVTEVEVTRRLAVVSNRVWPEYTGAFRSPTGGLQGLPTVLTASGLDLRLHGCCDGDMFACAPVVVRTTVASSGCATQPRTFTVTFRPFTADFAWLDDAFVPPEDPHMDRYEPFGGAFSE